MKGKNVGKEGAAARSKRLWQSLFGGPATPFNRFAILSTSVWLKVSTVVEIVQVFPWTTSRLVMLTWTLATSPIVILRGLIHFKRIAVILVSGILLVEVVSGLWSSDALLWRSQVIFTSIFLLALLLSFEMKRTGRDPLNAVLSASGIPVLLEAASIIAFRIMPGWKIGYLNSPLGQFLLGDSGVRLFGDQPNVLDPGKSGGLFFVNANVASLMMGMFFVAYLWLWLSSKKISTLVIALASVAGVLFTGSKTGYVLVAALGFFALIAPLMSRRRHTWLVVGILVAFLIAGGLAASLYLQQGDSQIGAQNDANWQIRFKLWRSAAGFFAASPILGLGFGGWSNHLAPEVARLGLHLIYPPHNLLIAAWSDSGLLTPLLLVVFFVYLVAVAVQRIRNSGTFSEGRKWALIVGLVVWPFLHGMADNTQLFGTIQTAALMAAGVSTVLYNEEQRQGPILGKRPLGRIPVANSPRGGMGRHASPQGSPAISSPMSSCRR